MKHAPVLLTLLAIGCSSSDRVTFDFDQDATRTEAAVVDVYAIELKSRGGSDVDCAALLDRSRRPDDGEVVVAQQTTVPLPLAPGPGPLLVRLPQQRFVFFAVARDRFGFEVARGCQVDEVTSRRALDLVVELVTVPAPTGELLAVDPTSWLQHAGAYGVGAAPQATVRTLDARGLRVAGIEVRALVESGSAVPTRLSGDDDGSDPRLLISDERGLAATSLLVDVGPARLLLHARGLANSPIAFDVTGLASPVHDDVSVRIEAVPVAAFAGNYDYDAWLSADLFVALQDASGTYGTYWRGEPGGSGFEPARRIALTDRSALVVGGLFDSDPRSDVIVAANAPAELALLHHDDTLGDSMMDPHAEVLPDGVQSIEQALVLRVDADSQDDLVLKVTAAAGAEVLVYLSERKAAEPDESALVLVQRFALPVFASNPTLARADVDGDMDDDLLLLNPLLGIWIVPCGEDGSGYGNGAFYVPPHPTGTSWTHLFGNAGNSFTAAVDVDEDGLLDLVVINDGSLLGAPASLQVARGNGTLHGIELDDPRAVALTQIATAAFTDLNADGHVDVLAVTNSPPQRALLMGGDGHGQFAAPLVLAIGMGTLALTVADVNVDGVTDLGFLGSTNDGTYLLMKLSR